MFNSISNRNYTNNSPRIHQAKKNNKRLYQTKSTDVLATFIQHCGVFNGEIMP